jgi:hypothetical protein
MKVFIDGCYKKVDIRETLLLGSVLGPKIKRFETEALSIDSVELKDSTV